MTWGCVEMTNSGPGQSGSFNRANSDSSSLRRHSLNSLNSLSSSYISPDQVDDDIESEAVSEAGDIGDRALHSRRSSESGRLRFSFDNVVENSVVVPIMGDASLQPNGFSSHTTTTLNTKSAITPSTLEIRAAASTDGTVQPVDMKKVSFIHISLGIISLLKLVRHGICSISIMFLWIKCS